MPAFDIERVREIAKHVRQWCEDYISNKENNDYFASDLCGMCCIASGRLSLALQLQGFPAKIASNNCHAFVVLYDHIVDVTATQFHQEEIFIRSFDEIAQHPCKCYWTILRTNDTVEDFKQFQKDEKWHKPECVQDHHLVLDLEVAY